MEMHNQITIYSTNIFSNIIRGLSEYFSQISISGINERLGVSSADAGVYIESLLDFKLIPLLFIICLGYQYISLSVQKRYKRNVDSPKLVILQQIPVLLALYAFNLFMCLILFLFGGLNISALFSISNYTPGISSMFLVCYGFMTFVTYLLYVFFKKHRDRVRVSLGLIAENVISFITLGFSIKTKMSMFGMIIMFLRFDPFINLLISNIVSYNISYFRNPFFNVSVYTIGEIFLRDYLGDKLWNNQNILSILQTLYSIIVMNIIRYFLNVVGKWIVKFLNHKLGTFTIPEARNRNAILNTFK